MINELFNKKTYQEISSRQVKELIEYLSKDTNQFSLTVKLKHIEFNPKLPSQIYDTMQDFTMFTLANFTLSSLKINKNTIEFETGFGASNFGSVCTMPFYSIFQVSLDQSILFINPIATSDIKYDEIENQKQRSMNAFKMK